MKQTKVTLVPLSSDDREQFIPDNQWVFKYGAMLEFGERDDHILKLCDTWSVWYYACILAFWQFLPLYIHQRLQALRSCVPPHLNRKVDRLPESDHPNLADKTVLPVIL